MELRFLPPLTTSGCPSEFDEDMDGVNGGVSDTAAPPFMSKKIRRDGPTRLSRYNDCEGMQAFCPDWRLGMARFIGEVDGGRGSASRLGTPKSGIRTSARGWRVGVTVEGGANGNADEFRIYATTGSNGGALPFHVGTVKLSIDGNVLFIPAQEEEV